MKFAAARSAWIVLSALWRKEAIALGHDWHGLAALFLMPVIFILIMSLALRDAYTPQVSSDLRFAVVDLDHGREAKNLVEILKQRSAYTYAGTSQEEADVRNAVRRGEVAIGLVIARGFDQKSFAARSPGLTLLLDPGLPQALAQVFRQQLLMALSQQRSERAWAQVEARLGRALPRPQQDALPEISMQLAGGSAPSAVQQSVPAWLIFAMFFVVIPLSAIFITEQQQGTLARLTSLRLSFANILLGKLAPYLLVNLLQTLAMLLVGRYLAPWFAGEALHLPADWQGLMQLLSVSAAASLAAICWGLLVASLARSIEQATIVGGVGNILMGAIGGVMVPKFIMPPALQAWSDLSPMAWAVDGLHSILLRQGGWADLGAPIARLLLFALAALVLAVALHTWRGARAR